MTVWLLEAWRTTAENGRDLFYVVAVYSSEALARAAITRLRPRYHDMAFTLVEMTVDPERTIWER